MVQFVEEVPVGRRPLAVEKAGVAEFLQLRHWCGI